MILVQTDKAKNLAVEKYSPKEGDVRVGRESSHTTSKMRNMR
jgi:hypothetical protein